MLQVVPGAEVQVQFLGEVMNTNDYGVPLHACNGHRQDEHYWAWLRAQREQWEAANPGGDYCQHIATS